MIFGNYIRLAGSCKPGRNLQQLPPMMDYDIRHGRTYMYFKGEPLPIRLWTKPYDAFLREPAHQCYSIAL